MSFLLYRQIFAHSLKREDKPVPKLEREKGRRKNYFTVHGKNFIPSLFSEKKREEGLIEIELRLLRMERGKRGIAFSFGALVQKKNPQGETLSFRMRLCFRRRGKENGGEWQSRYKRRESYNLAEEKPFVPLSDEKEELVREKKGRASSPQLTLQITVYNMEEKKKKEEKEAKVWNLRKGCREKEKGEESHD